MRSFFQQQPGFCLRLLRSLAAFFFSFRAKSQLYNQSSTHSNSHQPRFLTLIEGLNEVRDLKNPVAPSRTNNNKCYPNFPKIHAQETMLFYSDQGMQRSILVKTPGFGENLVLSSLLKSTT
jgi:hypothetical protein